MKNKTFSIIFLVSILFIVLTAIPLLAKTTLEGKILKVSDGDTVIVSPSEGGQFFKCRLYGIDAPESYGKEKQAYSEESKKELKQLLLGQTVEVTTTGDKTHNREVCIVKKDGVDVNLEMIKRGAAWAYRKYLKPPYASEYIQAEVEARDKKVGLWQEGNPEPPWEFRARIRGK